MKYLFILSILLLSTLNLYSQKKSTKNETQTTGFEEEYYNIQHKVLNKALKLGDASVAITAIYNMLALKPNEAAIKDTLALLYYNQNTYEQALTLGMQILESSPDNANALEIVAGSQQNLGQIKEALKNYETLFSISNDIGHLYIISTLQYALKRFGECNATLDALLKIESEKSVGVNAGNGQVQLVPVKAAAYNIKGVVAIDMNQTELGLQFFNKALEIFPQFVLAASNIEQIKKKAN